MYYIWTGDSMSVKELWKKKKNCETYQATFKTCATVVYIIKPQLE